MEQILTQCHSATSTCKRFFQPYLHAFCYLHAFSSFNGSDMTLTLQGKTSYQARSTTHVHHNAKLYFYKFSCTTFVFKQ